MHFGAVVADAPSPLSTPRSATGQAQLRLGQPLRKKCRASPDAFRHAGRVVARTVGIVRRYSPFSRGARRAGADQGGLRGARKRARTQCVASQPKQRGTGSRVRESGGRPGGRFGSRPTGTGISRRLPDRRRTWGENVRTFVQTHQATFAGVRGRACGQLCGQLCGRMYGQGEGGGRPPCEPYPLWCTLVRSSQTPPHH